MEQLNEILTKFLPYAGQAALFVAALIIWAATHEVLFEKLISDLLQGPILSTRKDRVIKAWRVSKPYLVLGANILTAFVLKLDVLQVLTGFPTATLGPVVGPILNTIVGTAATLRWHDLVQFIKTIAQPNPVNITVEQLQGLEGNLTSIIVTGEGASGPS